MVTGLGRQLHRPGPKPYSDADLFPTAVIMNQADLQKLEGQLDQLLSQFQRLKSENAQLRAKTAELTAERSRLLEKNELAAHKVEAMLTRLRGLEQRG
ncbi:TIGR02449 family protein [Permianibacter fluminis]|uniref:TIGR02449 family protein n=1 Tax=Permianibacter fluminis TaxID=2738515 RepID=UPI001F1F1795|nr:TIGR02449 family protein [Permianibacter fluminis]